MATAQVGGPGRIPARVRRWTSPGRIDALVVSALLIWTVPAVPWWWHRGAEAATMNAGVVNAVVTALVLAVPFLWRRRFPLPLLAWTVLATAVGRRDSAGLDVGGAAVLVAAHGVGAYGTRLTRIVGRWLGGFVLAAAGLLAVAADTGSRRGAALACALVASALIAGEALRSRQDTVRAATDAAHLAERTRIARELHDILAHQLSAIAVQAGAVRAGTTATDVQLPMRTLGTVEHLARQALTELNHLLGVLRNDNTTGPVHAPAPSLHDVPALVAAAPATTLTVTGRPRPLPDGFSLAAYRIVQEALTNVARHAPSAPTTVTVDHRADGLHLTVTNQPPPATRSNASPPSTGRGIAGMRERADLYGGAVTAASEPGGGFRVTAHLPYPPADPS